MGPRICGTPGDMGGAVDDGDDAGDAVGVLLPAAAPAPAPAPAPLATFNAAGWRWRLGERGAAATSSSTWSALVRRRFVIVVGGKLGERPETGEVVLESLCRWLMTCATQAGTILMNTHSLLFILCNYEGTSEMLVFERRITIVIIILVCRLTCWWYCLGRSSCCTQRR